MTTAHVMAGLQWKLPLQADGSEDFSKPPYCAAVLLVPVTIEVPKLTAEGADSHEWIAAQGLNIARWDNAYERHTNAEPTVKNNFVDLDVDRFVVRVPRLSSEESAQPKIKLSTVQSNGTVTDDATELQMKSDPTNSATLVSDAQILVSDDGDDVYSLNGAGTDDVKGDRTHKAGLFDTVRIALSFAGQTASLDWPVPTPLQVKSVLVQAVIMRNKPESEGGQPVASEGFVRTDITRRVNERFAQANIIVLPEINIKVMDPPPGVDMSSGLIEEIWGGSLVGDLTLIGAVNQEHTSDDVHIIYINRFKQPNGNLSNVYGKAYRANTRRKIDAVIVSTVPERYNNCLTAHELGHILGNFNDLQNYPAMSNLMYFSGETNPLQVVLGKRLARYQIEALRKSTYVH